MKVINLLLLLSLFGSMLTSQNSFVKVVENLQSTSLGLEIRTNDELSIFEKVNDEFNFLRIINFSRNGNFDYGFDVKFDTFDISTNPRDFEMKGKYGIVPFHYSPFNGNNISFAGVFCYDFGTRDGWCKRITELNNGPYGENALLTNSGKIVSTSLYYHNSPNPETAFMQLDAETGLADWAYLYRTIDSIGFAVVSASDYPNGDISMSILTPNNFGMMKISSEGEVLKNIVFDESLLDLFLIFGQSQGVDDNGNIYITGKAKNKPDWNNSHPYEGFIAKFNSDLELTWAKRLSAENFPHEGLKHKVFPSGEIVFAYNTKGDLPVIVSKLDTNGNLLWHRGYEFYNPEIQIGSDGSIYFLSTKKYFFDGSSEQGVILAKTDPA